MIGQVCVYIENNITIICTIFDIILWSIGHRQNTPPYFQIFQNDLELNGAQLWWFHKAEQAGRGNIRGCLQGGINMFRLAKIQPFQCKNNKTGEVVAIKKIKLESEDEGVSYLSSIVFFLV